MGERIIAVTENSLTGVVSMCGEQARAEQHAAAEAAMDAYLARRQELADADIEAMDRAAISEFIDAAKKYVF